MDLKFLFWSEFSGWTSWNLLCYSYLFLCAVFSFKEIEILEGYDNDQDEVEEDEDEDSHEDEDENEDSYGDPYEDEDDDEDGDEVEEENVWCTTVLIIKKVETTRMMPWCFILSE